MDGLHQTIGVKERVHTSTRSSAISAATGGEQKARDRSLQGGKIFTMHRSFSNGDQLLVGMLTVSVRAVVVVSLALPRRIEVNVKSTETDGVADAER